MPLVRIDLRKGKDAAHRRHVGRAVYEALISVGVPNNDRFQVVGEHEADDFLFDPDYLGIHRSDDLVMIQITWNEGRTIEQKKALYKAIAEGLATKPGTKFNTKQSRNYIKIESEPHFGADSQSG